VNHRQLELVRSSYERIRSVRPLFADLFHRRLLLLAPELDPLLDEGALDGGDPHPPRRDAAFLDLVDDVVGGLDRLDLLLPALAAHARRLHRRGVTDLDYEVAGKALEWTLAQVLAGSPAAVAAWSETYELLTAVMKRAAEEGLGVPPPPPRLPFITMPYSDLPPISTEARHSSAPPMA
jgi:hemoglobin-like flavoprotein